MIGDDVINHIYSMFPIDLRAGTGLIWPPMGINKRLNIRGKDTTINQHMMVDIPWSSTYWKKTTKHITHWVTSRIHGKHLVINTGIHYPVASWTWKKILYTVGNAGSAISDKQISQDDSMVQYLLNAIATSETIQLNSGVVPGTIRLPESVALTWSTHKKPNNRWSFVLANCEHKECSKVTYRMSPNLCASESCVDKASCGDHFEARTLPIYSCIKCKVLLHKACAVSRSVKGSKCLLDHVGDTALLCTPCNESMEKCSKVALTKRVACYNCNTKYEVCATCGPNAPCGHDKQCSLCRGFIAAAMYIPKCDICNRQ